MEKDYTRLLLAHCCAMIAMIHSETQVDMLKIIEQDARKIQEELLEA